MERAEGEKWRNERQDVLYIHGIKFSKHEKLLQKLKKIKLRKDINPGKKSVVENKALLGQQK